MRAVNLVPPESRGRQLSAGKSGGAVYGVIGGLVLVLLAMSALAITGKKEKQAQQELASVQQSTQAYQQLASRFAAFTDAASKTSQRIELVRSISDARFDWAGSLRDMARVMPSTAQVLKLRPRCVTVWAAVAASSARPCRRQPSRWRAAPPPRRLWPIS